MPGPWLRSSPSCSLLVPLSLPCSAAPGLLTGVLEGSGEEVFIAEPLGSPSQAHVEICRQKVDWRRAALYTGEEGRSGQRETHHNAAQVRPRLVPQGALGLGATFRAFQVKARRLCGPTLAGHCCGSSVRRETPVSQIWAQRPWGSDRHQRESET